jgi:hypothetical protein
MLTPYIKEFYINGTKTIEEDTYYKIDPGDLRFYGFNNVQTSISPNGSLQYVREMERTMFWQPGSVNIPGAFRYKPYLVVEWENGIEKKNRDGIGDFISINPLDRVNNKEATAAERSAREFMYANDMFDFKYIHCVGVYKHLGAYVPLLYAHVHSRSRYAVYEEPERYYFYFNEYSKAFVDIITEMSPRGLRIIRGVTNEKPRKGRRKTD